MPDLAPSSVDSDRLMQEMRVEQRSYLEEVEDAVLETEAAQTALDMRLLQLGNRSVEVNLEMADRQIRGRVVHVSHNIATVENLGGARFTIQLDRVMSIRFSGAGAEPRTVETGEPSSLISCLRDLWRTGAHCTIGRSQGQAVLGDIVAVTDGHVELQDPQGTSWLIPIEAIAWIGPKL